jgi:hypothetical protein
MKYWDLHDENRLMKLMVQDETIARSKIAKLQQFRVHPSGSPVAQHESCELKKS